MGSAPAHDISPLRTDGEAWLSWNQFAPVYVAGPMNGMPDHGFPAFHRAEAQLWNLGAIPMSPARGAPPLEVIETQTALHGDFRQSPLYAAMMRRDFIMVIQSRALFLLPGWKESRGAMAEARMGEIIGNPLFDGAWLLEET